VNIGTKRGGILEYKSIKRDFVKKANRMIVSNAINEIYGRNQKLVESLVRYRESSSRAYIQNIPFNPEGIKLMKDEADSILRSHTQSHHYLGQTE
jgi:hypothetical protein